MEWTKEDEQGNTLAYDNTASMFFCAAVLTCILIPWTIHFVSKFIRPNAQKVALRGPLQAENFLRRQQCECSLCVSKNQRMIKEARSWKSVITVSNLIQLFFLTVLWILNVKLCLLIIKVDSLDVGAFNPFTILGIVEGASIKEIKKAYRSLSLLYHPDRRPDDIDAAAIFLRISKAYNALTDETARKNFEKFGNPDGPGQMKVGLGLPKWVVQEENQLFVLCLFFVVVLGMIPLTFISIHNKMKRYSASGVRVETLQFLSFYMHDGTRAKLAPEFLAASAEARDIPVRESDAECLARVEKEIDSLKMYRQSFTMPSVTKNFYLILCHMMRKDYLLDENLRDDLDFILRSSPLVTQSMLELAFVNNWLQTVQSVLEFRRSLLQAQAPSSQNNGENTTASLLQIPWFEKKHVDAIVNHPRDKSIRTLRELVRSDFKTVLTESLVDDAKPTDSQMKDMLTFMEHAPDMNVTAEIAVDGEDCVVEGDVASCRVKLERANLKRLHEKMGKTIPLDRLGGGAVHCPFFPGTKFEQWFVFLSEVQGKIVGYKQVQSTKAVVECDIKFRVEEPGEKEMMVFVMCDSYSGLDCVYRCTMNVLAEDAVEREIFIHPEDAALDDEPNAVQSYLGELVVDSEDSESEEVDLNARKEK